MHRTAAYQNLADRRGNSCPHKDAQNNEPLSIALLDEEKEVIAAEIGRSIYSEASGLVRISGDVAGRCLL